MPNGIFEPFALKREHLKVPEDTVTARIFLILMLLGLFFIDTLYFIAYDSAIAGIGIPFILLALILSIAEFAKGVPVSVYSYGSIPKAGLGILLAVIVFLGIMVMPQILTGKTLGFFPQTIRPLAVGSPEENWIFYVNVAAVREEVLRFAFVPTIALLIFLGSHKRIPIIIATLISIFLIVNPAFALYHLGTYLSPLTGEPNWGAVFMAYVYGCGFSVMNYLTGTMMFSITYHHLHNLSAWILQEGIPDLSAGILMIQVIIYLVMATLVALVLYSTIIRGRKIK